MALHDLWWTLGFALILLPITRRRYIITRADGFLLGGYVVYLTLLALGY